MAECSEVLDAHPHERKALYRRGVGRLALYDPAAAVPDLRAALELCAFQISHPCSVLPEQASCCFFTAHRHALSILWRRVSRLLACMQVPRLPNPSTEAGACCRVAQGSLS